MRLSRVLLLASALAVGGSAPVAEAQGPRGAGGRDALVYAAAVDALEAGQVEEAALRFAEAVALNPRHADAHFGLARALDAPSPVRDARRSARALETALRLDPDNAAYLEAQLDALRRATPEAKAFSATDTRRHGLALALLRHDPANALAHEERALRALLEFQWRRGLAQRQGGYDAAAERGASGAANRARARAEAALEAALGADPARASAHRLRLRLALLAGDDGALAAAARAYRRARPADPGAALYDGLAAYRAGELARAEVRFAAALRAMPAAERAAFETLGPLLRDEDRAAYAADSAAFAARYWRSRDPRLLTPQNERRLEHLARLALADLLFADPFNGRRGWETPRGALAVRYGLPQDQVGWTASNFLAKNFSEFERWDYGDVALVFEDVFRSGDFDYASSSAGEDEVTRARGLFRREPERFAYAPPGRAVAFPMLAAAFRGAGGRPELVVSYGVPLDDAPHDGTALARFGLESGVFLLAADGAVVDEVRRTVPHARPSAVAAYDGFRLWTDGVALAAPPGEYALAVEFAQGGADPASGGARQTVRLPAYADSALAVSDVLPAYLVEEDEGGGPVGQGQVRRGRFVITPAPWGDFEAGRPLYLYAEAYGLALRDGRSRYDVEAELRPVDDAGPLARAARRLLGQRPPAGVAVRYGAAGTSADDGQYLVLDASTQPPGAYRLTLRVHDLHTDRTASATLPLTLR